MASVSYRKRGSKWYIRFQKVGRKEKTEIFPGTISKARIKRKVAWYREEIAMDRYDPWDPAEDVEEIHLERAVDMFVDDGLQSGRWKVNANGKSKTARTYRLRLDRLIEKFGDVNVQYLNADDIAGWIAKRPKQDRRGNNTNETISPVTADSHATAYNTFFKWLHKKGYTNDLKVVYLSHQVKSQARQIIKQPTGISKAELDEFCRAARGRVEETDNQPRYAKRNSMEWIIPASRLMFWLMLRREEFINIYPEDISEDFQYFTYGSQGNDHRPRFIPKSGIDTLPLLEPARKVFREMDVHQRPKGDPLFDFSPGYITLAFRRISLRAFDKVYSPHTFRHGGIIHLRSVIKQPGLVSRMARHASQDVTDKHYGGVDPVYLRRALTEEGL